MIILLTNWKGIKNKKIEEKIDVLKEEIVKIGIKDEKIKNLQKKTMRFILWIKYRKMKLY